jgi:hypothetical protein
LKVISNSGEPDPVTEGWLRVAIGEAEGGLLMLTTPSLKNQLIPVTSITLGLTQLP